MNEPLQPLTLSEILDRTAQLYRKRFFVFLGISIVPTALTLALAFVIGAVVAWWNWRGAGSVSTSTGYVLIGVFTIAAALIALPLLLAAASLSTAAINHATSCVYLGEPTAIRAAYKSVWRRGWRYIWLYLLEGLLIFVAPMAVYIGLVALTVGATALAVKAGAGGILGGFFFGLLVFLVIVAMTGYIFWMLLKLSLAFPACVVEQMSAWSAIKRSFSLSQGTKGRILLLYLLVGVLSWLLSMGITVPLTILLALLPGMNNPQRAQIAGVVMLVIVYGASFAVQALIKPVYGIALVLFYYDQRIRKEGFDIEWMMQQAGMVPAPPQTLPSAPWMPPIPLQSQPVAAADDRSEAPAGALPPAGESEFNPAPSSTEPER